MPRFRVALAGALAAAVALGFAELAAGVLGTQSLILAVGSFIVDATPGPVVKAAIAALGTNDRTFLITLVAIALGAALAPIAGRRFEVGIGALVAFGVVGFLASTRDPAASASTSALVAGAAVFAGLVALRVLLDAASKPSAAAATVEMPGRGTADRRRFLTFALAASGSAAATALLGRYVAGATANVEAQRQGLELSAAQSNPVNAEVGLDVAGLTPLFVPEDRFYRIDTALIVPRVNAETWRLRVEGMVDHPLEFALADILAMPLIEESVTLSCVSNEVGGTSSATPSGETCGRPTCFDRPESRRARLRSWSGPSTASRQASRRTWHSMAGPR